MMEETKLSFSLTAKNNGASTIGIDNLPDEVNPKKLFTRCLLKHVNAAVDQFKDKKLDQATAEKICKDVFENARRRGEVEPVNIKDLAGWLAVYDSIKKFKINTTKLATNILKDYDETLTQIYNGYIFPCDTYILGAKVQIDKLKKLHPNETLRVTRIPSRHFAEALMLYAAAENLKIENYVRCTLPEYKDSLFKKPVKTFKQLLKDRAELFKNAEKVAISETQSTAKPQIIAKPQITKEQYYSELKKKLSDPTKQLNDADWKLIKKIAEEGEVNAQTVLGQNYYDGTRGLPQDYKQAFYWLKKAADQNQSDAQYYLAQCYNEGHGVSKDLKLVVSCFEKAANLGHLLAQLSLGVCYYEGQGVPIDLNKAVFWFRKAAERENPLAQHALGMCYAKGHGVSQDLKLAASWYQKAANHGNTSSLLTLGLCYYEGQGVSKDLKQALSLFEKAANGGDPTAECMVARFYQKGDGVPKNDEQAAVWFRKAAVHGFAEAQFALGLCYLQGTGVSQDFEQAIQWFGKAAEQGNANAKEFLNALAEKYKEAKASQFGGRTSPAFHKMPLPNAPVYPEEEKESKQEEFNPQP